MAGYNKLTKKCAKCGACAQVCPVYLETGRESHCARGKLHLASGTVNYQSRYLSSILAKCIQCGACDTICPREIAPSRVIRKLRHGQSLGQTEKGTLSLITRKILNNQPLASLAGGTLALLQKLPAASGLRHKINNLPQRQNNSIPPPLPKTKKTLLYYPGCLARHVQTDIAQASRYLASLCDYHLSIPTKATCCGLASASSGHRQEALKQALGNMESYPQNSEPILTSCGSCYAQLKSYPELFEPGSSQHKKALTFADRIQEFSSFFLKEDKLQSLIAPQRVYYHDPCHLRFIPEPIMTEPRQLIRNINGQAVVNMEQPLGCCGQGGLFALANQTLAEAIFSHVKKQLTTTPQTTVVTSCSSCLIGLQHGIRDKEITVQHLSVFLAKRCTSC